MASTRAPLAASAIDCKAAHRIPGTAGQPCIGWSIPVSSSCGARMSSPVAARPTSLLEASTRREGAWPRPTAEGLSLIHI
eukprot:8020173-Alexandrium_andersonii.AAC.1